MFWKQNITIVYLLCAFTQNYKKSVIYNDHNSRTLYNTAVTILRYENKDISQYTNDVKWITTLKLDSTMENNKISTIFNWEWNYDTFVFN